MVNRLKSLILDVVLWGKDALNIFHLFFLSKKIQRAKFRYLENFPIDSSSTESWSVNQINLIQNIKELDIEGFLQWPVIKKTMFFQAPKVEFETVCRHKSWTKIKMALKENAIGRPDSYKYYVRSSGNLVHHAYSLVQLLNHIEVKDILAQKHIIEFGGGYGSFCRLIYNLGFSNRYSIIDLPIFSNLQQFYLSLNINSNHFESIEFINNENYPSESDMFVGLWSLSECPIAKRREVFSVLQSVKYVLIAYQESFSGINNLDYFETNILSLEQFNWFNKPIKHLPGNHYLIGIRKQCY